MSVSIQKISLSQSSLWCLHSFIFISDVSILVLVSPLRNVIQHLLCKTQKAIRTMRLHFHWHVLHRSKKPTSLSLSLSISFNNHYDVSILPLIFPYTDHSIFVLISPLRTYTWHLLLKTKKKPIELWGPRFTINVCIEKQSLTMLTMILLYSYWILGFDLSIVI